MSEKPFPMIPGQRGLATAAQLARAGWSPDAVRHLARTRGRRVAWSVYSCHPRPLDDDDWLVAGWLWAGQDSVLTGARALSRRGIDVSRLAPPRFLVPATRRRRLGPRSAVTVRTRRLPTGTLRRDVPVAPLERALVDAAVFRELPLRELRALTIAVLQNSQTTADRLEDEVEASRRHGGGPIRESIAAFRAGAWSAPEALLIDTVRAHPELPMMLANPRLETASGELIGTPDGYFQDSGVAVQVHSRAHHTGIDASGGDLWVATVENDSRYQRHGIVVVQVIPELLERDPAQVVAMIAAVVTAHRGRVLPGVVIAN